MGRKKKQQKEVDREQVSEAAQDETFADLGADIMGEAEIVESADDLDDFEADDNADAQAADAIDDAFPAEKPQDDPDWVPQPDGEEVRSDLPPAEQDPKEYISTSTIDNEPAEVKDAGEEENGQQRMFEGELDDEADDVRRPSEFEISLVLAVKGKTVLDAPQSIPLIYKVTCQADIIEAKVQRAVRDAYFLARLRAIVGDPKPPRKPLKAKPVSETLKEISAKQEDQPAEAVAEPEQPQEEQKTEQPAETVPEVVVVTVALVDGSWRFKCPALALDGWTLFGADPKTRDEALDAARKWIAQEGEEYWQIVEGEAEPQPATVTVYDDAHPAGVAA